MIDVQFMKKPSMAQVTGHKNQALISLKAQKRKTSKTDSTMEKIYMGIINLKIKEIHTSTQTIIVFITLIQKKRPSVIQRTHGLEIMLYKLSQQHKTIK